ncbi:MAG TPA: hypothetical protein VG937_04410 [Polyangiaceae bacterium]|nr:hypothetical protein [Polyangiaceae bacterium]
MPTTPWAQIRRSRNNPAMRAEVDRLVAEELRAMEPAQEAAPSDPTHAGDAPAKPAADEG